MTCAIVFICQQGDLERQALLLAASLARWSAGTGYRLIAALPVPAARWGRPAPETLALLRHLGAQTVDIENQIDQDYPIGNKISCLMVEHDADVTLFLDSDMLCLRPLPDPRSFVTPFAAKVADANTFTSDDAVWEKVYARCGLSMPADRVIASTTGESMPPYFNAGFIAVHAGIDFGTTWRDVCLAIDADPSIPNKRPWLDQIGLPVTVRALGIDYTCIDESLNFPCYARPIDPAHPPYLAHYHRPSALLEAKALHAEVRSLCEEHDTLQHLLREGSRPWRRLLWSGAAGNVYRHALAARRAMKAVGKRRHR